MNSPRLYPLIIFMYPAEISHFKAAEIQKLRSEKAQKEVEAEIPAEWKQWTWKKYEKIHWSPNLSR